MGKEEVIEYVMTTPGNPNRAVLSGMLDSIAESGGGTVEVSKIKIATAEGGGSTLGGGAWAFGGGGRTVDNKSLAELLGDKTVINAEFIVNGSIASCGEYHFAVSSNLISLIGINGNDSIASDPSSSYCTVNGICNVGQAGSATIDIYAICI